MGFARLAQQQMQSAVDSAALEGLRWRDVQQSKGLPQTWFANPDFQNQTSVVPSTGTLNSQQCDAVRRWAASNAVASLFTDYVDSSGGTVSYGAGPVVNFGPAIDPNLAARQTISWPAPPPCQPTRSGGTVIAGLELNIGNLQQGDMVAGAYGPNSAYNQQSPTPTADEDDTYNRRDFQAVSALPTSRPSAFLLRMQRAVNSGNILVKIRA